MPDQVPFRELAVRQLIKDVAYPDIESSFQQMQCKGMKNKSFIGIDISKNVIDASIFCDGANIKSFPHKVFDNSRTGFKELCSWLKTYHVVLSQAQFGMEFTGCYSMKLEKFLTAKNYQFCMLGTQIVKHHPIGPSDKSDKIDSAKIADFLARYEDSECLKPYTLPSKTLMKLEKLTSKRKFLVEQRTSFINRKQIFNTKEDAAIYTKYIKALDKDIKKTEHELEDLIAQESDLLETYTNLLTIPGIGLVNAINVMVITRNFTAFDTGRQYARYVGVAPCHHTSGTSVSWRARPSARCDGQAKADLSMAALRAVKTDMELSAFYNRKLGGKNDPDTKRKALNAVKFKLILRMFAIGKQKRKWEMLNERGKNATLALS